MPLNAGIEVDSLIQIKGSREAQFAPVRFACAFSIWTPIASNSASDLIAIENQGDEMTVLFTRVATPIPGKILEAVQYAQARRDAVNKTYALHAEMYVRFYGDLSVKAF